MNKQLEMLRELIRHEANQLITIANNTNDIERFNELFNMIQALKRQADAMEPYEYRQLG
jgi:hypothetical protein